MATVYVLIMLMYVPSVHASGSLGSAEFSDQKSCLSAASAAKAKFDGWGSTLYYVCEPKDINHS